ncbi:DUF2497 domain-containing protein [Acidisoma silvae]|uniref:DUF2497 domain-containing protein n=1 Tax=Acidisoma silvae TaxID=2802396 RepID=A0A964E0B6_9PROT|nr:DUF2497 domain-containing protein [Acidisoma silvae]MCB8877350.1 DUF2497 domain-containing protein [Acidisoma silvae]
MTATGEDGPQTDQSMDDILASIRRIMLDEQARLKDGPVPEAQAESPPAPFVLPVVPAASSVTTDTVLVLDDSMVIGALPGLAPAFVPMTGNLAAVEPVVDHVLPVPEAHGPMVEETVGGAVVLPPATVQPAASVTTGLTAQQIEEMLAPTAAAAAAASVDALLRKLAEDRDALLRPVPSASPSMEEFVRGELRPLLKSWLDEHLPSMVERLVRAELARLTLRHGG